MNVRHAASSDRTARFLDHLMDSNNPPSPRMPSIRDLALGADVDTVGVLSSCSITPSDRTAPLDGNRPPPEAIVPTDQRPVML